MGLSDATDASTKTSGTDGEVLPSVPATQPPQHKAVLIREGIDDYLAKRNLLGVALLGGLDELLLLDLACDVLWLATVKTICEGCNESDVVESAVIS